MLIQRISLSQQKQQPLGDFTFWRNFRWANSLSESSD